jgi:hypothetical protein
VFVISTRLSGGDKQPSRGAKPARRGAGNLSAFPTAAVGFAATLPQKTYDSSVAADWAPLPGVVLMIIDGVTKRNQHGSIGFFSAGPQWREIWPNVPLGKGLCWGR